MKNIPVRHIQSISNELRSSQAFGIRDVGEMLAGKDMVQELHRHDFFYVLVLTKGDGVHEIDFFSYDICDRSIFFMRPGQVHQLSLSKGSTGYLIQFKKDFYYHYDRKSNQLLRKISNTNLYLFGEDWFNRILNILTYIFQEYTYKHEEYEEVINANLKIFFIELFRQRSKILPKKVTNYPQERLEEFLELLETHVFTHKQVSQYAEMMNLSLYQLNAITKTTLGKRCSEIINDYIILESKRNLLATSSRVNQIAYQLGFEDVSYFIRFFKKQTGRTPESFRKNFK